MSHTILVIEDEGELRELLSRHLEREGFTVLQAENGAKGLALALDTSPDLILLDLRMPEMTGYEMIKRLRSENAWGAHVPVILLTNLSPGDDDERRDIEAMEPAHYIVKSEADPDDIVVKIRELLR